MDDRARPAFQPVQARSGCINQVALGRGDQIGYPAQPAARFGMKRQQLSRQVACGKRLFQARQVA